MTSALWIKICGLQTSEAIRTAIDAGADAVGFVWFAPSPRHIHGQEARTVLDAATVDLEASKRPEVVSLTVDASDQELESIVSQLNPDIFQLHGQETPERAAAIRSRYGKPVMKALLVSGPEDMAAIGDYRDNVDRILFDARPPKGATRPGGNGETFDWSLLDSLDRDYPYVLGGGLGPDNVAKAVTSVRPWGIDVSSGVESSKGVKSPALIRAFVEAARSAAANLPKLADAAE